jgi:phenylalanine ammonia-lyase
MLKSHTNHALIFLEQSYGTIAALDTSPDLVERTKASVNFLTEALEQGRSVYGQPFLFSSIIFGAKMDTGVTTGFGGSADTSTTSREALQTALIQMQTCAVLPVQPGNRPVENSSQTRPVFSNGDTLATLSMPEAWVRGTMLVRCNSLLRGHSAVRLSVIETLAKLLQNDIIPLVPLRGSISASGDLCPLSYIAATLEGNPDVYVWSGKHRDRKLVSADTALRQLNIMPISYGPKEALGILNGTACSVTVAALAQHQADNLAVFSQVLTAMGVEALLGTVGSFDPFIAAVRPHRGQVEVARNILSFLKGSKLARGETDYRVRESHLRQDRYALRTASQWIGPQLEDLCLAREQLEVELNSTTDNPLLEVSRSKVHHSGNFQAAAVTSSTEKARSALQMIGKLLFSQSTELLDTSLSNGLPPNLAADEPSLSYTCKGIDINMAAYMSELAFLANPISSDVQSAEMSNQSVNSLALISARYTHMAIDVLSLMSSAYLYSLCQALDLRAMNGLFLRKLRPGIEQLTMSIFGRLFSPDVAAALQSSVWSAIATGLESTTIKDSSERFIAVANFAQPTLIKAVRSAKQGLKYAPDNGRSNHHPDGLLLVSSWSDQVAALAKEIFISNREAYMVNPDATPCLGVASKRMYKFVREELGVPFHRGLADHPTSNGGEDKARKLRTTGSQISIIFEALRDETLIIPVIAYLREALAKDVPKCKL